MISSYMLKRTLMSKYRVLSHDLSGSLNISLVNIIFYIAIIIIQLLFCVFLKIIIISLNFFKQIYL